MSSSLRRGALAAAAIAFSITSLAACAAGNNSQTLQIKPDNAATSVGDIKIQNALVITQPDLESTGPAVISATLFNSGTTTQKLDSIKVAASGESAELKAAKGGSLTIPAGGSLIIGGEGNASAVLSSGREAIQDGNAQKVTFTFSKTGDVSLRAFVVPAEDYFEDWGPSKVPTTPEATDSPTGSEEDTQDTPADEGADAGTDGDAGDHTEGDTAAPSDSPSQTASGH